MLSVIEESRPAIERGIDRETLRATLPTGGARNALDCALWELESRRTGQPVHVLAGIAELRPRITTFTLPVTSPNDLRRRLAQAGYCTAHALKLKLEGDLAADSARVRAVREARPDTWFAVDANQGYSREDLPALVDMLAEADVSLLEQPLARGEEKALAGFESPIPIAADESILNLAELRECAAYFDVVNIKLDKCGGLTEALMIANEARNAGKQVMVGNMAGSTLAAAPAFVLAQLCDIVDLDGPFFLAEDPLAATIYRNGSIFIDTCFWGAGDTDAGK